MLQVEYEWPISVRITVIFMIALIIAWVFNLCTDIMDEPKSKKVEKIGNALVIGEKELE